MKPNSICKFLGIFTFVFSTSAMANDMSFFITSAGPGEGANLGGLEGADAHCAKLAKAAGAKKSGWNAYLSTTPIFDRTVTPTKVTPGVNARDRIGSGPWHNAKGEMIAKDVGDLHANAKINKETGLDEKGNQVNGRSDKPNRHDILTGSGPLGRYSTASCDTTCKNWTEDFEGSAIVGHHDRAGLNDSWNMVSWNTSHGTVGCDQEDLIKTGGDGLFYCFATD
jgi:hypothetical protein